MTALFLLLALSLIAGLLAPAAAARRRQRPRRTPEQERVRAQLRRERCTNYRGPITGGRLPPTEPPVRRIVASGGVTATVQREGDGPTHEAAFGEKTIIAGVDCIAVTYRSLKP